MRAYDHEGEGGRAAFSKGDEIGRAHFVGGASCRAIYVVFLL